MGDTPRGGLALHGRPRNVFSAFFPLLRGLFSISSLYWHFSGHTHVHSFLTSASLGFWAGQTSWYLTEEMPFSSAFQELTPVYTFAGTTFCTVITPVDFPAVATG